MTETGNSQDRMQAALVVVATLTTIAYNFFAAAGLVNGVTPDVISNKYPTVLTPAGYAFSIWTPIYLGLAVFAVYQVSRLGLQRSRSLRILYIFSCLLNCGWIYCWHHEWIGLCLGLILVLLATLFWILILFRQIEFGGGVLFTTLPFGIYTGWVTAAAVVNFVIFLRFVGIELSTAIWNTIGVGLIILVAGMAVIVRWKLRNYFYPVAIAWALTAIAVKQGGNTSVVVASAVGVVICLVTAGSVVVELKDTTSE